MASRPDSDRYDEQARRLIDTEQRSLTEKKQREDCKCKEGMFPNPSRRQLLGGVVVVAGATSSGLLTRGARAEAPPGAVEYDVPDDPTKVHGRLTGDEGGYGTRSQFEREVRWRLPTPTRESSATGTPLAESQGIITPSGLHFERHHGGTPTIDPAKHTLIVHGMAARPKKYTMADLKRFPSVTRIHFIECSGNGFFEWREPTMKTVQGTHGLTSTSEWTGVPLSTILREVGVQDGAAWILAEGSDAAVMTRSVPIDKAWDDALLVYAQNGEAIRPEQGYPLRLLLPGYEGNAQIKWLRRLEIGDQPYMTREETSHYTDLLSSGKARQFTLVMDAKSVITFPSGEMKLPGPGFYEVTGLAWSGRGRIRRVEVSVDGGQSWQLASLEEPILPMCHTRFRYPWRWDGQLAVLQSRCQDETGYVQPTLKQLVDVRGLGGGKFGSFYHLNAIQSWQVATDGSVTNVHV